MIRFMLLILFLSSCGIESAKNDDDSFTFQLNAQCLTNNGTTGCDQNNNGMQGRAYGVLTPCSSLFGTSASSSEVSSAIALAFTNSSKEVNCTASSCQATFETWTVYDPKGSITFFILFDSDGDGNFGETGEPYACQDDVDYEGGVLSSITDSTADLGYDDIQ